jgi:outer membrane protein assembly factor BamB
MSTMSTPSFAACVFLFLFVLGASFVNAQDFAGNSRKNGASNQATTLLWKQLLSDGAIVTRPVVLPSSGDLVLGTAGGVMVRVMRNSTIVWTRYTGPISCDCVIGLDGTVFFGAEDYNMYAITDKGTIKWRFTTQGSIVAGPIITQDQRLVFGSRDGTVYCLNSDGMLMWQVKTQGEVRASVGELRDGAVVVGSLDGNVYCIDNVGSVRWTYNAGAEMACNPLVQDVSIIIGTRSTSSSPAKVLALKMDGSLRWTYNVSGNVDTGAIQDPYTATVYITDKMGKLYAIQQDGSLLWRVITGAALTPPTWCNGYIVVASENK